MTEKPALTPPSLKWLAFVRIKVPSISLLIDYLPSAPDSSAVFLVMTAEKKPNSLRDLYLVTSPFLSMSVGIMGGWIRSIIRYVLSVGSWPLAAFARSKLSFSSWSKKLFPPPSFYGLRTNSCGFSSALSTTSLTGAPSLQRSSRLQIPLNRDLRVFVVLSEPVTSLSRLSSEKLCWNFLKVAKWRSMEGHFMAREHSSISRVYHFDSSQS